MHRASAADPADISATDGYMARMAGKLFTAMVAAGILFAGGIALAQDPRTGNAGTAAGNPDSVMDRIRSKMREQGGSKSAVQRWFDRLDTDMSGDITKQELYESLRKRFEAFDADRDRFVTQREYMRGRTDGQIGQARFGRLDANADGRLDMTEFSAPADWRFDRIDRNLDGKISRPEADRLFDQPAGQDRNAEAGACFYVERQIVRVKAEKAEEFRKRGYPKADCEWRPDITGPQNLGTPGAR